jgi:hypothetical protein
MNMDTEELYLIAERLPEALRYRAQSLTELYAEQAALLVNHCTGTEYWRDDTYLYCHHSVGESCPVHGPPPSPKGRLRKYVGSDLAAITLAKVQMDNYTRLQAITRQIRALERSFARLADALRRMYEAIGYQWNHDGPPTAIENWEPSARSNYYHW